MERIETRHARTKLEDVIPRATPFAVFIDPCGACNFKCCFCPCNNSQYRVKERHQAMSWDIFQRALQGLKTWAQRDREAGNDETSLKVVNLYGFGEPLMNPRIANMVCALKESQVCREIRLFTNGALLTEELGQQLIDAGLDILRVSVEALDSDGYRELCGVDIQFDQIVENVAAYYRRSRGTSSQVTAKIVSATLKGPEDLDRFNAIFEPISDYYFVEDLGNNWPEFDEMKMPDQEHVQGHKLHFARNEARRICTLPFTDMMVHSDGTVSACCVDWKAGTAYGNLAEQSLDGIWRGQRLRAFQLMHLDRSAYQDTICRDCCKMAMDDIDEYAEKIAERLKNC